MGRNSWSDWMEPICSSCRVDWLLKSLVAGSYLVFLLIVGDRQLVSYHLRYLYVVLFLLALILSFRAAWTLPWWSRARWKSWIQFAICALLIMVWNGLVVRTCPGHAMELSLPLRGTT